MELLCNVDKKAGGDVTSIPKGVGVFQLQRVQICTTRGGTITVSLPCFYKRRGKNISGPKNCHLLSLPRTYQLIDFALDLANIHCSTEKLKLFS